MNRATVVILNVTSLPRSLTRCDKVNQQTARRRAVGQKGKEEKKKKKELGASGQKNKEKRGEGRGCWLGYEARQDVGLAQMYADHTMYLCTGGGRSTSRR